MARGSKRKARKMSGCMGGMMNLFNFRRVQSGNKLITNSKNAAKYSLSGRFRGAKEEKNKEREGVEAMRRRSRSCDMDSDARSHEVKRSAKSVDFDDENKGGETKFVILSELKRILTKKPQSNESLFAEKYMAPELKIGEDKFEKIYTEARKHIFDLLNNGEKTPNNEQSVDGNMNKDAMMAFPSNEEGRPSPVSVLDASILEEKDTSPLVSIAETMAMGIVPLSIDFEEAIEESMVEEDTTPLANIESLIVMEIAPFKINLEDKKTETVLEREQTNPSTSIVSSMAIGITPLRIDFGLEEKEVHTVPDLVTYLLESANINWDQLHLKSYCSDQAIDPAITEKDFFGDMGHWEKKMLIDCVNEVITEIWRRYTMKPMPEIRSTIREIRERVNWHRSRVPPPCSLDQLGKKDLTKPGLWMDLQEDASLVAAEIGGSIFNDLIDELTLTL